MNQDNTAREPRRDPTEPLPEQAPGARQWQEREGDPTPAKLRETTGIEGASEDFAPRTTTDIAQHAPGPHGQGDEPSSAPAGRHDYDDEAQPEVRPAGHSER